MDGDELPTLHQKNETRPSFYMTQRFHGLQETLALGRGA